MRLPVPTIAATVVAVEKPMCVDENGEHTMLVTDDQALVGQSCDEAKRAETVSSKIAKLRPVNVTNVVDCAILTNPEKLRTAESKLKIGRPVPTADATVTLPLQDVSKSSLDKQPRLVADVHDDVTQTPRSSPAVAEKSREPKLSPLTLNNAYPLCGAFSRTSDATAESKLKIGRPVPAADATVTLPLPNISKSPLDTQPTVVAEVHDDVKHTPRSSPALAVASLVPKLTPLTVNDAYPLSGKFASTDENVAASNVNIVPPVPTTLPTVAAMKAVYCSGTPVPERQLTDEADDHDEVAQTAPDKDDDAD